jgi:hypothetical protein
MTFIWKKQNPKTTKNEKRKKDENEQRTDEENEREKKLISMVIVTKRKMEKDVRMIDVIL